MKTSYLLPEECKQEIRERIVERKRWTEYPPLQGRVAEAVIRREIVMLEWVLEEEK